MLNTLKSVVFVLAATLFIHDSAFAVDEYNTSTGVTTAGAPLGLHGSDPVALITLDAVAEGDAAYTVVHDGVAYYFASKRSADTFSKDPAHYLPQYGAFCAYAVAKGKKFDGDPQFADIRNGKLYLFVNAAIFAEYMKNPGEIIARAEKMWPKIQHKAVGSL